MFICLNRNMNRHVAAPSLDIVHLGGASGCLTKCPVEMPGNLSGSKARPGQGGFVGQPLRSMEGRFQCRHEELSPQYLQP